MAKNYILPVLKKEDVIWLAGLFEGEGSFVINGTPSNAKEKEHPDAAPFSVSFMLTMTDYDVVAKAGEFLGVKVVKPTRLTSTNKQTYRISSEKRELVKYLSESVFPYMGERRKEAIQKVLDNCQKHQRWVDEGGPSKQARRAQIASTAAQNQKRAAKKEQEEQNKEKK
jgi:hypothetical protein